MDQCPNSAEPTINLRVIAAIRELREEGEQNPVPELIRLFLQHAPLRLEQLEESLRQQNGPALEAAAHGLKGSGANIGAETFAGLCAELVALAKRGAFEEAARTARLVRLEWARVRASLETLLATEPP